VESRFSKNPSLFKNNFKETSKTKRLVVEPGATWVEYGSKALPPVQQSDYQIPLLA